MISSLDLHHLEGSFHYYVFVSISCCFGEGHDSIYDAAELECVRHDWWMGVHCSSRLVYIRILAGSEQL